MANEIVGRGIDAPLENRPGVPMESRPPRPAGNAHWATPEQQIADVPVLMHAERAQLTPVFGTSTPPRGLSGAVRRLAYRIPDQFARHWLLLMLADRIDVQESRLLRLARHPFALGVAAIAGGMFMVRALRK